MDNKQTHDIWSILQTVVLTATAAGVFLMIGRRDQVVQNNSEHISELREISRDLVKSQVLSEANDSTHANAIRDLKLRLDRLEHNGG
tara:strand:- start:709 stop:969 length:261 start_codon:yes stop_codon:yes gene_type:complete